MLLDDEIKKKTQGKSRIPSDGGGGKGGRDVWVASTATVAVSESSAIATVKYVEDQANGPYKFPLNAKMAIFNVSATWTVRK